MPAAQRVLIILSEGVLGCAGHTLLEVMLPRACVERALTRADEGAQEGSGSWREQVLPDSCASS